MRKYFDEHDGAHADEYRDHDDLTSTEDNQMIPPPPPGTFPPILCMVCGHGIDPHGINPGGACGVGRSNGPCECFWSPNDIAASRLLQQMLAHDL